jgi:hypothetical protein
MYRLRVVDKKGRSRPLNSKMTEVREVSGICYVRVCPVFFPPRTQVFQPLLYKETPINTIVPSVIAYVHDVKYTYDNNNQYYSIV